MDVLNYKIFKNAPFCKSPKQQNCCRLYVQLSAKSDEFISKTQKCVIDAKRQLESVSMYHTCLPRTQNTKIKIKYKVN